MPASLTLYELAGADPELRFSPHCWKTRMALAHKGIEAERRPWRFTDKEDIAFSGQGLVPVLVDDGEAVSDSWRIAEHLESRYPDRPSLFGGEAAQPVSRFVNSWADSVLVPAISRVILIDIDGIIHEKDRDYFRSSREQRYGMRLEEVVSDREARLAELGRALAPLRTILRHQPFIAGNSPLYADYCAFGPFMWARCVSTTELLAPDDPVFAWRERLLDAFEGLARSAQSAQAG
ncbi:glutathione S-transferase family protein [Chelatococcus sp. GCM10030263]|uniref:glutathione S-transferase family protein n=1 Tax=Chelatococcus sp. GCM10030263 TaxID=3273387 RepID=UPI00360C4E67